MVIYHEDRQNFSRGGIPIDMLSYCCHKRWYKLNTEEWK